MDPNYTVPQATIMRMMKLCQYEQIPRSHHNVIEHSHTVATLEKEEFEVATAQLYPAAMIA